MPAQPLLAVFFGLALWCVAVAWHWIVVAIPLPPDAAELPYISANLAVSVPVLFAWWFLVPWLARRYLAKAGGEGEREGYLLGQIFLVVVSSLDFLVYVLALGQGDAFYYNALLWAGYGLLFWLPWKAGKKQGTPRAVPARKPVLHTDRR